MILALGIGDILSALSLGLITFSVSIPWLLVFLLIFFLIAKVFIFFSISIATIIDVLAGIFFILAFFIALPKIALVASGLLFFKGVRSVVNV
jgi:membrane protein CcdC involved in cytochrome C biogenesis